MEKSETKMKGVDILEPTPFINSRLRVMGIDPGKYFGIAIVGGGGTGQVKWGKMDDSQIPLREVAYHLIQSQIEIYHPDVVILEGASYGDRFGQVKLAEVRCGFALGVTERGIPIQILAPKTPRKTVFGHGDIGAWDVWVRLDHNGADALCLALYPIFKEVL